MSERQFEGPPDPNKIVADEHFKAPDLLGTVEGWRAWKVRAELPSYGASPKLYSVTQTDYFWAPRKESIAFCQYCGEKVPGEKCMCGFYSAKTLAHLMQMNYHAYNEEIDGMVRIVGQVANWGKVIEASSGWRAQKSYPVQLFVPFEAWQLVEPLSEAYGVPVHLKNVLRKEIG